MNDETEATVIDVAFDLNGRPVEARVPPERKLIDFLRYDLGMTGTKEGCGNGVCGACTVLVGGEIQSACLTFTVLLDGASVQTVEGLGGEAGGLSQVQRCFVEHGGLQCGFCTPGQVVAATALLAEIPNPTDADVRLWMEGNLCRCTGYYKIVEAIRAAADTC